MKALYADQFARSIHGARNFPFRKHPSDPDIRSDDGADAAVPLEALEPGVRRALEIAQADLRFDVAPSDSGRGGCGFSRLGRPAGPVLLAWFSAVCVALLAGNT